MYFLSCALTTKQQRELAYCALNESLSPPNRTNLHCHYSEDEVAVKLQDIWRRDGPRLDSFAVPAVNREKQRQQQQQYQQQSHRQHQDKWQRMEQDMGKEMEKNKKEQAPQRKRKKNECAEGPRLPPELTLSKVRWATLGYQYDWTARTYHKEQYVPFPAQLGEFSQLVASACKHADADAAQRSNLSASAGGGAGTHAPTPASPEAGFSMIPQAGIVNFYPAGQVMGGHVDDGEEAQECPVVSYSLGPPCIFLLGGLTKDVAPVPLLLRSGDILVLGGESRLKYHGIPKVFVDYGPPAELIDFTPKPAAAALGAHEKELDSESSLHQCGCPRFLSLTARSSSCQPEREAERNTGGASSSDSHYNAQAAAPGANTCACTCGGISNEEISRTLKVLRCARINVNLRQVYRAESKSEGKVC